MSRTKVLLVDDQILFRKGEGSGGSSVEEQQIVKN